MRAGYGEGLREQLSTELAIRKVIDFGDLPLFDANGKAIAAYPAVLVGQRAEDSNGHTAAVADLALPVRQQLLQSNQKDNPENVRGVLKDLSEVLLGNEIPHFPQAMLKADGWVLEDPALVRLFERMMNLGKPLGEFVGGRLYRGVVTGLNEAFVIDQAKRDELIEEDPRSAELIKPWLRGRDIGRWTAKSAGLNIIFTSRGVDIDQYPVVQEHLKWFRSDLEKRATANIHPWYELQQPQEGIYHEFAVPKIVWPDIAREVRFAYDTSGYFLGNTSYIMPTSSTWLLTLLNSALLECLICQLTNSLRGGFIRLFSQHTSQLPIVTPNRTTLRELNAIATAGVASGPVDEDKLNEIVYDLYDLSPAEVRLLEGWFQRRSLGGDS